MQWKHRGRFGDAVQGCGCLSMLLLLLLLLLGVDDLVAGNSNSGPGSSFRNCGNQLPHCKVAVVYTLDFPSSPHVITLVVLPAFPCSCSRIATLEQIAHLPACLSISSLSAGSGLATALTSSQPKAHVKSALLVMAWVSHLT